MYGKEVTWEERVIPPLCGCRDQMLVKDISNLLHAGIQTISWRCPHCYRELERWAKVPFDQMAQLSWQVDEPADDLIEQRHSLR